MSQGGLAFRILTQVICHIGYFQEVGCSFGWATWFGWEDFLKRNLGLHYISRFHCTIRYNHLCGHFLFLIYLLYFKFWGTVHCVQVCNSYTRAMVVVCCIHHPIVYIRYFYWCYPSPVTLPTAIPPLAPPTDLSAWCSPPCVPVFSLFNPRLWLRTCVV